MTTINTVLAATMTKSRKKLIMASIKSHALMAWAFASGRVEYEDGGYEISNPLAVGRNPNVTSYQYFEELPVAQTDEFITAKYSWSRVAGTVIISDQEEDENRGAAQIFKLVTAKMDVLEESIKDKFGGYLYGTASGNDPNGLGNLIPDDPTTGTVGNISRATQTQWRTSSYNFGTGGIDETNIEEVLDDVLLDLTMKTEKPDIILMGRSMYRIWRAAIREKIVINLSDLGKGGKGMVDLGFKGGTHEGIPLVYDEDCPINKMYFINSKFLRLHILKHVNMKVKKLISPWTVDASGQRVVWQGQWCSWKNFRTHAVVLN